MVRSRNVAAWCLIGASAFAGCRIGYDEILVSDQNAGRDGGTGASVGSGGSNGGTDSAASGAGQAGADATGGALARGGNGGSPANGGTTTAGGDGGAPETAGSGGAGESAGGSSGADGGVSGTSGGSPAGPGGEPGDGGASDAGASGASGGSGGSGGTTGGVFGAGGFAGAASLGDCQLKDFAGHDYVFCDVNLPWTEARDNCASIGMLLVRVDDGDESQWVADNVYDSPPRQGVWIGASDAAQEGEWRWTDGTLFWLGSSSGAVQDGLFNAWYPTQPSGQEPRDCAALDGNELGWYDLDCTIPQPYACESP
jgi:hypothetical protein